jgi:protein-S-isoprenylcysteine O-methyltransferase Ste14
MSAYQGGSVSSASLPGGNSAKRPLAIVLGIIGVLAIVLGIVFMVATGLPGFLTAGSHVKSSSGHHIIRGAVALVVGVVLVGAAWWVSRTKKEAS